MISFCSKKIKYLNQQIYNDYIFSLDFTTCSCPCGATGRFDLHGYYERSLKTPSEKIILSILRIKCKSCNKTHAVLHPSIVPYSHITLTDTIDIIVNYDGAEDNMNVINNNPEITESDVKYTIKKYVKHWKERILSLSTIPIRDFLELDTFQKKVSQTFCRAFMQIKRCFYGYY